MVDIVQLSKSDELFDGRYKLLRPLSMDGATADVWLAVDMNTIDKGWEDSGQDKKDETGMMVAIKIYRPKNALDIEGEQRFRDEFKIVYECRHANLLQPTSFSIFEECPYLVLPYCSNGSSEQLIGKPLKEWKIWKYIQDVAAGLNRLHTNNPLIVHQDIKPANILLDNNNNYAITDFGISSRRGGMHNYYYDEENSGTLAYMAPERFVHGAEPMPESDIWAFGATLCEILTGKVPFGEEGGLAQSEQNLEMPSLQGVPAPVQRLIRACLDKEPGNRPSAQEILSAARAKQFPVKKRTGLYVTLATLAVLLAAWGGWMVSPVHDNYLYNKATEALKSDDKDVFMTGYELMSQLCKKEYIPAMYDMAEIHDGVNNREEAMRRKEMSGITQNASEDSKAMVWYDAILKKSDARYASVNAKAALSLASYYLDSENINENVQEGERYLKIAMKWAQIAGDENLVMLAQKSLLELKSNR